MAQPLTDAINALTTYANTVTGASDTTLSDAVATLAAGYGGGGTPEVLPAEYTAVNYVQNSGDAYINTGIHEYPDAITAIEGRFEAHNASSSNARTMFGYQGNPVGTYRFTAQISTSNALQYYGAQSGAGNINGWNASGANDISIDFTQNATYPVWKVNNTTTTGNKRKTASANSTWAMYLMVSNYQNGVLTNDQAVDGSYVRCYDFKMYCYDFLVRHFVPCIRNADSKVGFYEYHTETFYPSIGANEFTSG